MNDVDRLTDDALASVLRHEADHDRPGFSPDLHARILASVKDGTPLPVHVPPRGRATMRIAAGIAATAALLAIAIAARPTRQPTVDVVDMAEVADVSGMRGMPDTAATIPPPREPGLSSDGIPPLSGIPTLDEIGEALLAETTSLAADAAGLPRWNELVESAPWQLPPRETP